jgi:hypothetical protein
MNVSFVENFMLYKKDSVKFYSMYYSFRYGGELMSKNAIFKTLTIFIILF